MPRLALRHRSTMVFPYMVNQFEVEQAHTRDVDRGADEDADFGTDSDHDDESW